MLCNFICQKKLHNCAYLTFLVAQWLHRCRMTPLLSIKECYNALGSIVLGFLAKFLVQHPKTTESGLELHRVIQSTVMEREGTMLPSYSHWVKYTQRLLLLFFFTSEVTWSIFKRIIASLIHFSVSALI